jgi:transposase
VYVRFNRWSKQGVWHKVFEQLAKEPNNEYALMDATIVRRTAVRRALGKKGHVQ